MRSPPLSPLSPCPPLPPCQIFLSSAPTTSLLRSCAVQAGFQHNELRNLRVPPRPYVVSTGNHQAANLAPPPADFLPLHSGRRTTQLCGFRQLVRVCARPHMCNHSTSMEACMLQQQQQQQPPLLPLLPPPPPPPPSQPPHLLLSGPVDAEKQEGCCSTGRLQRCGPSNMRRDAPCQNISH